MSVLYCRKCRTIYPNPDITFTNGCQFCGFPLELRPNEFYQKAIAQNKRRRYVSLGSVTRQRSRSARR